MPEEFVIAVGEYLTAGELTLTAGEAAFISAAVTTIAAAAYSQAAQRSAQNAARDAYNSSLRDRYIMTRGAAEPRQIVLGRARTSGPMFFIGSYGANREHLTFIVALAGHEIDAVEQVYFDDMPVTLDGSGNVTGVTLKEVFSIAASGSVAFTINTTPATGTVTAQAVYGTTVVALTVVSVIGLVVTVSGATNGVVGVCEIRYQPNPSPFNPLPVVNALDSIALNGSGNGNVTLAHTPIAGSVHVTDGSGVSWTDLTGLTGVVGNVVTVTTGPASTTVSVQYQYVDTTSRARVRTYLGAAGEAADAATIANFPGVWTSAHIAKFVAKLVVEFDYDPTAFPNGLPNVSARVRGAKVLDPRTGITAWSDNLALLTNYYAQSPLGGRLTSDLVNVNDVMVGANVCDTTVNYVVNGQTYTRALYRGGTVAKTTARPQDVITDLTQAMAGKWVFNRGQLRIRAGSFVTPVLTLDESWLHEGQQVHLQPHRARVDLFNAVTCSYADESQNYQVVPMPRLVPPAYVAEDGVELPLDLTLASVQFSGQAQHVTGCLLRDSRFCAQLTVLCNMKAYTTEVFDTLYVSLARFGYVSIPFEVLDRKWTLIGGIQLSMKMTDASINALAAAFVAFDAGKATRLPSPFKVADIAGLSVTSGSSVMPSQSDGTVVQRMLATWTAATDPGILDPNGGIEIRYGLSTLPDTQWTSVFVDGHLTQAYLPNVQFDRIYLVKARGFNAMASGNWCAPQLHKVGGVASVTVISQSSVVTAVSVTNAAHTPDTEAFRTAVVSLSYTPKIDMAAKLTISGSGQYATGTGGLGNAELIGGIFISGSFDANDSMDFYQKPGVSVSGIGFSLTGNRTFNLTANTAYTFKFLAKKYDSGDTVTVTYAELAMSATPR